jgi:regulator of cell morphogenesis and NO signaling
MRELTDGYDLEQAMCNTHRATLDGLRELELDLHQHIHEENNVLFPRALAVA